MSLRTVAIGIIAAVAISGAIASNVSAQQRTLHAGSTGGQPPMSFVGADGVVTGVVVDLLAAIGAEVGFGVEHVIPVPLGDQVAALLDGRIDITGGTFAVTAERAAAIAFTIPYMVQGEALVVRGDDPIDYRSLLDLRGQSIGVVRGSSYVGLVEGMPPGTFSEVKLYELTADLPAAVARGEVRGAIYGAPIAAWHMFQGGFPTLKLAANYAPAATQIYAFAMRKEETDLLARFNVVLERMMTDGTVRAIFTRYGLPYADYTR